MEWKAARATTGDDGEEGSRDDIHEIVGGWVICGTPEIVQVTRLDANFSPWFLHARIKLVGVLAIFPFSGGTWKEALFTQRICGFRGVNRAVGERAHPCLPHQSPRTPRNPTSFLQGVAPVGVVVPLSAAVPLHPSRLRELKNPKNRSTTPFGGQKHLTFLCLTRGNPIDSQIPPEPPSHTPTPVTEFLCQRVNIRVNSEAKHLQSLF